MSAADKIPVEHLWKLMPHTLATKASLGYWTPGRHHVYISRKLAEAAIKGNARMVIHWPPGHGKSTLLSKWYPIWRWETFGRRKIIFATHSANYARYWGEQITNELGQRSPMLNTRTRKTAPSSTQFLTTDGGEYFASGVEGGIIGHRADDLIFDDPIANAEEAFSETSRSQLRNFYDSVARTRLEPNANVFLIMQRWHEEDLAGHLIEQGFEYVCMPAIAEENDPLGRKPGEALWPERFPIETLKAVRDGDPKTGTRGIPDYFWQSMYQGKPVPVKGRIIDTDWIRTWTELPEHPDEEGIFADFNIKEEKGVAYEGEKNDYTVFGHWARKGADCYLTDLDRGVWGITDQVKNFLRFAARHPRATGKYFENKANAPAAQDMLCKRIHGIILLEPRGGKVARAMACEPMFKAGNVWIPANNRTHPWVKAYIEELRAFPGGKHDDQVDMTSMALLHFDKATTGDLSTLVKGWGG